MWFLSLYRILLHCELVRILRRNHEIIDLMVSMRLSLGRRKVLGSGSLLVRQSRLSNVRTTVVVDGRIQISMRASRPQLKL